MKQYTCKKCNKRNNILPEWDESDKLAIIVSCEHCGHKARYRPKTIKAAQNKPGGTVVLNTDNKDGGKGFILDILKGSSGQVHHQIAVKKNDYNIYIGRNPKPKAKKKVGEDDEFFVIQDPFVSRIHAVISVKVTQQGVVKIQIRDHDSVNGVIVNGEKLLKKDIIWVNSEDTIEIGETILKLKEV